MSGKHALPDLMVVLRRRGNNPLTYVAITAHWETARVKGIIKHVGRFNLLFKIQKLANSEELKVKKTNDLYDSS